MADSSLKAALDLDWDEPVAKTQALSTIVPALDQVEFCIQQQPETTPKVIQAVNETLSVARQIQQQDVEVEPDGSPKLRRGTAKDRPIAIVCKAWPVRNGDRFTKHAFTLDWQDQQIHCPNGVSLPFEPGQVVRFPAETCANCPLQQQCTTSQRGRSVPIHPDEQLFAQLRQRQATRAGRAQLRQRVQVEHSLAQVSQWQGDKARYRTQRKNLFDLRRIAVIHNLHVIARMPETPPGEIAA